MNNKQTLKFNTNDIKCYVDNGEPWFKGNDVASILGYARPNNDIRQHVPDTF